MVWLGTVYGRTGYGHLKYEIGHRRDGNGTRTNTAVQPSRTVTVLSSNDGS